MTHATDQQLEPTGATSGAPGRAALDPRFGHGPYEAGSDAVADARDVYIAARGSDDRELAGRILEGHLLGTLHEAGVTAGAYDRRILAWLTNWEPEVVIVYLGCVERAHIAGRHAAAQETTALRALVLRACTYIAPCPPPDVAAGFDSCVHGTWPCARTELGWQLRGLDPEAERSRAAAAWRSEMAALDASDPADAEAGP